jgi:membrane protein YqaA with SNARE-associated domain
VLDLNKVRCFPSLMCQLDWYMISGILSLVPLLCDLLCLVSATMQISFRLQSIRF